MNGGTLEKTSSSLAIVEKKPQRPGGCVGVLFQLFDWNRRFAKKKLFTRKLIPPVRSRQASKDYGGNEKQPRLRLIADENSGGFPTTKKKKNGNVDPEPSHEMRSPGLVARLMGLESMPASQRDKSKKAPLSGSEKEDKLVDNRFGCPREELNTEKGRSKHELRPQKLQKMSSERPPMPRTVNEALGFKNVLSRSKKHHHPKLPVPVKSPRNLSRKNASKLIGAATRILEPGLQTSRSKCALTYLNTLHPPPKQHTVMEEMTELLSSQDLENSARKVPTGQASCRNCGNFRDNLDSKPCAADQRIVFGAPFPRSAEPSCQWSERSKPGQSAFYQEFQEELHENYQSVAAPATDNLRHCVKVTPDMNPYSGRRQRHFSRQQQFPPPLGCNHKLQSPQQMLQARDRVPPKSKFSSLRCDKESPTTVINEAKHFSLSRSLRGSTRSQMYSEMDSYKFEMGKSGSSSQNDLVASARKRRPTYVSRHGESYVSRSSTAKNRTHSSPDAMSAKDLGHNSHSISQRWCQGGSSHLQQRINGSGEVNRHVVSFPFSSPVKQRNGIEKRRIGNDSVCTTTLRKSALSNDTGSMFEKPSPITGDALGALLKQKLNELTSQGEDIGGGTPKKTTAMILQELILALNSDIPFQQNNSTDLTAGNFNSIHSHLTNQIPQTNPQMKSMDVKLSVDQPLDSEHLSPGSVLETCFSNQSCISSSIHDSSGYQMINESAVCSYNNSHSPNPSSQLLDSAIRRSKTKSRKELTDILNNIYETLCCIDLTSFGLKGSKLDHAKEVLLNSELIFHLHTAADSGPIFQRSLSVKHLIIEEMETLASLLWINFGPSLGIEDCKEVNQLRRFVFDSIIEYLDLRFGEYPNCGSKVSTKLPLRTSTNMLLFEIAEEVKKWGDLSRFVLDDLIDREMTRSAVEWTEFEAEIFETGMDISSGVLESLLDEIVLDLGNSSL